MSVTAAMPAQLALVRDLLHTAVRRQVNVGDEDLAGLIEQGSVFLCTDGDEPWGVVCLQSEARPATLPPDAPTRVYLRATAFRPSTSPTAAMQEMLAALQVQPAQRNRLLIAYSGEPWLDRALRGAGLTQADQVIFFALADLPRRSAALGAVAGPAILRSARPDDLDTLARLDAVAFDPLWHMAAPDLVHFLWNGRLQAAILADQPVGYLAMTARESTARLARLAVHPAFRGQGIGRQLMVDSLAAACALGCTRATLNTQASNERSQHLYRSLGFRPTGERVAVFTLLLTALSSANQQNAPAG